MKKWILGAVMLVALGLLVLVVMSHSSQRESTWVKLPDGSSVRIRAVTYGTNHIVGSDLAKLTVHLPAAVQDLLGRVLGQWAVPIQTMITPTPELVVWLDGQATNGGSVAATSPNVYFEAFLGDGSNFISGESAFVNSIVSSSQFEPPLQFHVFPRRNQEITLNLFYHDTNGKVNLCNSFSFANPQFRKYPVWQAEPPSLTKRVGDAEASLLALETGYNNELRSEGTKLTGGTNRQDGRNYTIANLRVKPLANANEVWQAAGVELSDATGNIVTSQSMGWSGESVGFQFEPGLWPDEAAWKLKLSIKRLKGFRPEEMVVFKNVPLGETGRTNILAWTTNCNGVALTLESVCRRPPPPATGGWSSKDLSEARFTITPLPADTQVDLLDVVYNTSKTNHSEYSETVNNMRTYRFREMPTNAQTADFVIAVQKVQTVEFTAKPELPKPKPEAKK